MFKRKLVASGIAAVLGLPLCAHAESDAELAQIREQIRQLKESYEARIQALEERLQKAEAATARTDTAPARTEGPAPTAAAASSESAFNPAVSVILQGSYNNFENKPDTFRIGGFIPGGGEGLGKRGFSLGESELAVSANIDPRFRGSLTAAITPEDSIEVEEAFFQTLGLASGLTVKGGRFFSGIGYLNEQHQHAWDFADTPLVYQAFLGTGARGNFSDDGLQVKWLAPTDMYLELGAEVGRGRGFPGSDRDKNGTGLGTVFAHAGGDIGESHAWRAGLSYLRTRAQDRPFEDTAALGTGVTNAFSGSSRLWIADFVWKWSPEGNARYTNFRVQGEYFRRKEDGRLAFDVNRASGLAASGASGDYASSQSGWYLQGAYQFAPYWRVGLRHDRLDSGSTRIGLLDSGVLTAADFPLLRPHDPRRNTVMVDYSPSEFSRLRLQWARDESRPDAERDNQVFLQYIYSLGAHGAHRF